MAKRIGKVPISVCYQLEQCVREVEVGVCVYMYVCVCTNISEVTTVRNPEAPEAM